MALDKVSRPSTLLDANPDEEHLFDLWRLIDASFNEDEVRTLCFALGVEYDNLGGTGKSGKVRELIALMRRVGRLSVLVEWSGQFRPGLDWARFLKPREE